MRNFVTVFAASATVLLATASANASLLTNNPGFEADGAIGNNSSANNGNTIMGWDFQFGSSGFAGFRTFVAADDVPSNTGGSATLQLNNTSITTAASSRAAVVAGTEYILSVKVGEWVNNVSPTAIQVLAIDWYDLSGVLLSSAETSFDAAARDEDDPLTIESVSGFAPVGAVAAGARFDSSGDWVHLDDFSLTIIPEPSSIALAGIGGVLMVLRRRKADA